MSTPKKPSSTEEEYFAREEAQRRQVAQLKQQQAEDEAARQARIGTCPGGCPTKLVEETYQTIRVDRCPTCGGVWLDPGEIDQIAPENASVLRSAVQFFAGKSPTKR
jgi:uncharacterized protein